MKDQFLTGALLTLTFSINLPFFSFAHNFSQNDHNIAIAQNKLTEYKYKNLFSFKYLSHWRIEERFSLPNTPDYMMLFNYPPISGGGNAARYYIKTDIYIVDLDQPFEQRIKEITANSENRILEQKSITVNGKNAYRIKDTDSPFAFPDGISTVIQINDSQAVEIYSFYTSENEYAEDAILALHNSFQF